METPNAVRTYRVTTRARFGATADSARDELIAEVGRHGVLGARFTAEGTVTYGPDLRALTFRCEVELERGDGPVGAVDARADEEARRRLQRWAGGRAIEIVVSRVDITCLDDVRIRRPRRTRA